MMTTNSNAGSSPVDRKVMRQEDITDLAHELWATAQMAPGDGIVDGVDRIERLLVERFLSPRWDDDGEPTNLAAATEDAYEWLSLIERLHNKGRGPWKFLDPNSLEKLGGCSRNLRNFLTHNA